VTAVDGPFIDAKDVVGGYAVFDLKSQKETIEAVFMELLKKHRRTGRARPKFARYSGRKLSSPAMEALGS
jgi:hypothetical protein